MENLQATSLPSPSQLIDAARPEIRRPEILKDLCAQLFRSCYAHVEVRSRNATDPMTSPASEITPHVNNAIGNVATLEETDLD